MSEPAPTHDRTRRLQFLFLLLFVVALAQVVWWIFDQAMLARRLERETIASWEVDRRAAMSLLESLPPGPVPDANPEAPPSLLTAWFDRVAEDFPHLALVVGGDGGVEVIITEQALKEVRQERQSHLRQYLFEGAFFFIVILSAVAVLWRVLRKENELWRRQENFLAAVSHELKSPLASLRLNQETLLRRDLDGAVQQDLYERSLADVGRLDRLIGNLLETSRIEDGSIVLRPEPIDLPELLRDVASEASGPLSSVPVEVEVVGDGFVTFDPVVLRTIVRNLVDNAVAATEVAIERGKGGAVNPVTVRADRRDSHLQLEVTDRGIGFEPAEAKRLFEKFYRPGDELRRSHQGTGLGLYLVERFVAAARGTVEAQSAGVGQGATFVVELPLSAIPAEPERAAGEAIEKSA